MQLLSELPWPVWVLTGVVLFLGEWAWRAWTNYRICALEAQMTNLISLSKWAVMEIGKLKGHK